MPKPDPRARVKPGDTIVWQHYSKPGEGWQPPVWRSGEVFALAPVGEGLRNAWWVVPDAPLPGEVTAWGCIAVGDASRSAGWWDKDGPAKGDRYGSAYWRHQPAALTYSAASCQQRAADTRELEEAA